MEHSHCLYIIQKAVRYRSERESPPDPCFECRMAISSRRNFNSRAFGIRTTDVAVNHGYCGNVTRRNDYAMQSLFRLLYSVSPYRETLGTLRCVYSQSTSVNASGDYAPVHPEGHVTLVRHCIGSGGSQRPLRSIVKVKRSRNGRSRASLSSGPSIPPPSAT